MSINYEMKKIPMFKQKTTMTIVKEQCKCVMTKLVENTCSYYEKCCCFIYHLKGISQTSVSLLHKIFTFNKRLENPFSENDFIKV